MISIIIPCYNAEKYVDRFMTSIVNQTLNNSLYEVIAVNDASTDNTLSKLYEWKEKYPESIKIITYDKNIRPGGARNRGILEAEGDYIGFLDADDWIEPNALEEMFEVICSAQYDMVIGLFSEDKQYHIIYDETKYNSNRVDKKIVFGTGFTSADRRVDFSIGYIWNAIYRKDIITDNDIWYPENIAYEDIYWINLIKLYVDNVYVIDMVTHHHYYNTESTLNKRNAMHHVDRLTAYEKLLDKYCALGIIEQSFDLILKQTIEVYIINSYFMFFTRMDEIPDVYGRMKRVIDFYFPEWTNRYNEEILPIPYNYLIKFFKKSKAATVEQMQVFKDAVLEVTSKV